MKISGTKTIYLVRHGLATHSQTGYGDQALTAGLLPEAKPGVDALATKLAALPITAIWSSPVPRCLQTATSIATKTGVEITIEPLLSEYYPEIFPPFLERLQTLATTLEATPLNHLVLCTHGSVIAGLTRLLSHQSLTESSLLDYPPPAGLRRIHLVPSP